jgi:SAM-dependent methyltransferase
VLETAAGTGIVTRALRDALPADTEIVATDLNQPMLDVAAKKMRAGERVKFQTADAQQLPFADGSFDAVACQFGIMFFPDKPKSYRETFRVLAPGGRYFFSVWDTIGHNPFAAAGLELATRLFPDNTPPFFHVPFGYAAIDPVKEALREAGFADLDVAVIPVTKAGFDLASFAGGMALGNPFVDQVKARGVEPRTIVQMYIDALVARVGNPPRMPIQAILFSALKST